MKKTLSIFIAVMAAVALLAGCGGKETAVDRGGFDWYVDPVMEYDDISMMVGNYDAAVVTDGGKKGLIDMEGNIVLKIKYGTIYQCYCVDENGSKYIAVDDFVINSSYENCGEHPGHGTDEDESPVWDKDSGKAVVVGWGDMYDFYAEPSRNLFPVAEVTLTREEDGLYKAHETGRYGYINTQGELVIPLVYEQAMDFTYDQLALVKKDGKWGYIDPRGSEVIPCVYDDGTSFLDGYAAVSIDGKWCYIDTAGNRVCDPVFDKLCPIVGDRAYACYNGRWGILNCIDFMTFYTEQ